MMNLPIELDANGNPKVIDWSSMMNALGARNLDRMYETLRNPDGSYNWDAIEAALSKPYAEWTDALAIVLAAVYLNLNGVEKEQFLRFIVQEVEVAPRPWSNDMHMPHQWTEWRFDERKLARITNSAGRIADGVWIEQFMIYRLEFSDVNSPFFTLLQPYLDAGNSFQQARNDAYLGRRDGLNNIFQSLALLNILQNAQAQSSFRGAVGADAPLFQIGNGENGAITLSFANAQTEVRTPGLWEMPPRIDTLSQTTLNIHPTAFGSGAVGLAVENMRTFYNLSSSPSFLGALLNNGGSFTVEGVATLLAEQAIPNLGQLNVAGTAVNFPVVGLAFLPATTMMAHLDNVQTHNDLVATADSIQLANLAGHLDLHATIVTDGSATQQIFFQPSVSTPHELERVNAALGVGIRNGSITMPEGLSYPLDMPQIAGSTDLVSDFLNSALR